MPAGHPLLSESESTQLAQLGSRLRAARLRRRLNSEDLAKRVGISRMTLFRAEKGEPAVTLGTYVRILQVLRLEGQLALVARDDDLGEQIQHSALPQRDAPARKPKMFKSAEAMSDYQHDRELAEALKVHAMPASSFSRWLQSNWGRLQDQANNLYAEVDRSSPDGRAFHFRTPEEKNEFDRARETEFALQVAASQD